MARMTTHFDSKANTSSAWRQLGTDADRHPRTRDAQGRELFASAEDEERGLVGYALAIVALTAVVAVAVFLIVAGDVVVVRS
jgi:hypothetical protein